VPNKKSADKKLTDLKKNMKKEKSVAVDTQEPNNSFMSNQSNEPRIFTFSSKAFVPISESPTESYKETSSSIYRDPSGLLQVKTSAISKLSEVPKMKYANNFLKNEDSNLFNCTNAVITNYKHKYAPKLFTRLSQNIKLI